MITLKVKETKSLKEKIVGLIGKQKAEPILIKTRFGIHTFGVRFPIDVLILDRENRIRHIKQNLKPNKLFFWNPKYYTVIELQAGTVEKEKIKIGKKIELTVFY